MHKSSRHARSIRSSPALLTKPQELRTKTVRTSHQSQQNELSSFRRSRLVGRPLMNAPGARKYFFRSDSFCRRSMLASVSLYKLCATDAGPRLSDTPCTTTSHSAEPLSISSKSPDLTLRAGLMRSPFKRTLPPSTASVANVRVLKNRATQSHLSMRTLSLDIRNFVSCKEFYSKAK